MMIIACTDSNQDLLNFADTSYVCPRNSIADISFYDSTNFVTAGKLDYSNRFPILFTEESKQIEIREKKYLTEHLRPGNELPSQPLHAGWIIWIILIAAFLFSIIRATTKSMLPDVFRFFLFRGINDPASRDTGRLFNWQSTILNLISFFIIALFAYCAASYYSIIPSGISGFLFWLISLVLIILVTTLRHVACEITGNLSGAEEIFREYLNGIYLSYRFGALFLLAIVIMISYTVLFPVTTCLTFGIVIAGIMYLISVVRLMIIFLNRNISIFYLILYLCALEILPVAIFVKYFTGVI
jgi:hypothetical protein